MVSVNFDSYWATPYLREIATLCAFKKKKKNPLGFEWDLLKRGSVSFRVGGHFGNVILPPGSLGSIYTHTWHQGLLWW